MTDPIRFIPLFMERVWGGRELERFGRRLPHGGTPIGESWEIVDRAEAQSVVANGAHAGRSIHDLWMSHREEVFGSGFDGLARFPLLIKLLDARERLSLQVHPPARIARELGGEPKTECWYLLDAAPDAEIYAGLRRGATREQFEKALANGSAENLVHRFPARKGGCVFIHSGRLHAIGAGTVILETQQNSDTTYRVFDWNRVGLDGKPRELHIAESLASIDFEDFEPGPVPDGTDPLIQNELFCLERIRLGRAGSLPQPHRESGRFSIYFLESGSITIGSARMEAFELALIPARSDGVVGAGESGAALLRISAA